MRVIVPAVKENCLASLALRAEGIYHETRICDGAFGYGKLVADLWRQGRGFILVEHDIVPWPGALKAMWECSRDWCGYPYLYDYHTYEAKSRRRYLRSHAIGCVKFSDVLVKGFPELPTERQWENHHWQELDGVIGRAIVHALRNSNIAGWHEHSPPVAHIRSGR